MKMSDTVSKIQAKLVYDGGDDLTIPEEMGTPAPNQMQGPVRARVAELASRVCYDSLGKGRSSELLHAHLKEVMNLSVYEHTPVVVRLPWAAGSVALSLIGRPGIGFRLDDGDGVCYATVNYRAVLEWDRWTAPWLRGNPFLSDIAEDIRIAIRPVVDFAHTRQWPDNAGEPLQLEEPQTIEEKWVTLYLSGSRGFSHENVRHRWQTGMSQRSSRYCNESESPYVRHPLLDELVRGSNSYTLDEDMRVAEQTGQQAYREIVDAAQAMLVARGVDATNARKQARGAARGYLGNALPTEMIFSASVRQWKWQLFMRGSASADAEIRRLYAGDGSDDYPCVLKALRESRYAEHFTGFRAVPSSDGIGAMLVYTPEPGDAI